MSRLKSVLAVSLAVAGLVGANVVWAETPAASATTSAASQRPRPHLVHRSHPASTASATSATATRERPHLVHRSHRLSAAAKAGS